MKTHDVKMRGITRFVFLVFVMVIGIVIFSTGTSLFLDEFTYANATLNLEKTGGNDNVKHTPANYDQYHQYPLMRPDKKTFAGWIEQYENAREISASKEFKRQLMVRGGVPGTYFSLLSHVNYIPDERDQGSCGNCWQWAGMGVMETALDVQNGVFDRLSVQYVNSCESETIDITCCDGGWLYDVANFYNITKKATPWSNINAAW